MKLPLESIRLGMQALAQHSERSYWHIYMATKLGEKYWMDIQLFACIERKIFLRANVPLTLKIAQRRFYGLSAVCVFIQ
jgi:hypothetical protein